MIYVVAKNNSCALVVLGFEFLNKTLELSERAISNAEVKLVVGMMHSSSIILELVFTYSHL